MLNIINTMNKEIRNSNINIRTDEEGRIIEGYACVFNSESEDLGFFEVILPSAITDETIANSDVLAKFNHSDDQILARSRYGKGSLLLEVDSTGLHYMFEAPHNSLGDSTLEYIHRGDLSSSSFAFTVAEDGDRWEKRDGKIYRTISKIDKLYDIAPCWNPAYSATSCSSRAKEMVDKSEAIDNKLNLLIEEIDKL